MTQPSTTLTPVPEDWQTGLAIVAHPDDLEYGAAAAVARWTTQGKRIVYLLASRGEAGIDSMPPWEAGPLRFQEEINSARVVGVDTVEFLDYPDGVIEYSAGLRRDISRSIRRHRPEVLLTINYHLQFPTGHLNMADHRWVGLAALDAARDGESLDFPGSSDRGTHSLGRSPFCRRVRLKSTHACRGRFSALGSGTGVPARTCGVPGEPGRLRAGNV